MLTFHYHLPSKVIDGEGDHNLLINQDEIYIETENGYFPGMGWNDLLLKIIPMWISNTIRMLNSQDEEQHITNYFMDGPYYFDIQKMEKGDIVVKFIRSVGKSEKEKIPSLNVSFTDYCHALLDLAENIINDPDFQWYGKEQERINFKQSVAKLKTWL